MVVKRSLDEPSVIAVCSYSKCVLVASSNQSRAVAMVWFNISSLFHIWTTLYHPVLYSVILLDPVLHPVILLEPVLRPVILLDPVLLPVILLDQVLLPVIDRKSVV